MKTFLKMIHDESGASAAEYALILAVVGVGIIVAAIALGGAVGDAMNCAANTIQSGTTQEVDECAQAAAAPAP